MNQRPGKTYKSASSSSMGDAHARNLVTFFSSAKRQLEQAVDEDAAFYFAQIEELLREGKPLPTNDAEVRKALGL